MMPVEVLLVTNLSRGQRTSARDAPRSCSTLPCHLQLELELVPVPGLGLGPLHGLELELAPGLAAAVSATCGCSLEPEGWTVFAAAKYQPGRVFEGHAAAAAGRDRWS